MLRINGERIKEERIIIYFCNECGILDYQFNVIQGGKICPGGCGYYLENEEQE